jgi:hypothetical protein
VGAITGAILGAVIAGPRNAGAGLIFGGVAGGLVGTAAEQQQRAAADAQAQQFVDNRSSQEMAVIDARATNYRRAIGACLEGRGYSVK